MAARGPLGPCLLQPPREAEALLDGVWGAAAPPGQPRCLCGGSLAARLRGGSRRGRSTRWSPSALNRDVLGEHTGSAATEVGFRGRSRDIVQRKPNPRVGRQQRAYFSFKPQNLKDRSLITISLLFALFWTPATASGEAPVPPGGPPAPLGA